MSESVHYKEAIDYNYIVNCTLEGKVLPTNKYRLRGVKVDPMSEPQKKTKVDESERNKTEKLDIKKKDITKN